MLCAEHGLSVIEHPKPSRGSYGTWLGDAKEPSFQQKLRQAIDAVLAQNPSSFDAFLKLMQASGYTVKYGKHIKLTGPGQQRGTRLDTLGGDRTGHPRTDRGRAKRCHIWRRRACTGARDKVQTTHRYTGENAEGKGAGYAHWARSFNLYEAAKTLIFLQEQGIGSYDDLLKKAAEASAAFNTRNDKIRAAEKRMDEIKELQKAISDYGRTREIHKQYKAAGYSAKFRAAHEADIIVHQAANKHFDSLGLKK